MDKWECQGRGCRSTAVGVGGAIGLRAIGWYFELGPVIFCPAHRPDARAVRDASHDREDDDGGPCSLCTAKEEAQQRLADERAALDRENRAALVVLR